MNAKKTAISFLLLGVLGAAPAMAGWGIGPLVGMNLANPDVEDHKVKTVTGWAFGARIESGMLPFLSVMLDPMLVKTGAEFDATATEPSGEGEFTSLEIPVLLKAKLQLLNVGVYGFLGPDLFFNTDASGRVSSSDASSVGLAGQVGAGALLAVAPLIHLTLDARYSHGFTDLLDGAKGDVKHWRSRDVRLTLGLLFHSPI
ncbi:MAG: outer membrane beta-barrel protein [Fibrobacteria bacterium]